MEKIISLSINDKNTKNFENQKSINHEVKIVSIKSKNGMTEVETYKRIISMYQK